MASPSAPALSPSRALDFERCPLLFRLRVVDRLPEPPSLAAFRGTVVHAVLERLFALAPEARTREWAVAEVIPTLESARESDPATQALFAQPDAVASFVAAAGRLVDTYFSVEDPRRLSPRATEMRVSAQLEGGLTLRGIIDRLDEAPLTGELRVVDYKTGKSPAPQYQDSVAFQVHCYALALWRAEGRLPSMLQVIYLADGQVLHTAPREGDTLATEQRLLRIWDAIAAAVRERAFAPRRGPLCAWCAHQAICPAFGGKLPALPEDAAARLGLS